jgi:hypothetical protein
LVGAMLQLSVPLRKNWLASPATGLRVGPIGPQAVSTMSAAPPLQLRPAVEMDEQTREGPEAHAAEPHDPHDPGV